LHNFIYGSARASLSSSPRCANGRGGKLRSSCRHVGNFTNTPQAQHRTLAAAIDASTTPAPLAILEKYKMLELRKSDCADSISYGLNLTKSWRDKLTARYSDPRNALGAALLATLASDAGQLSDADYLRLIPYFESGGAPWRAAISKAARAVGFYHRIRDLPTFIAYLMEVLEEPVFA
jgi:hypothetical protein